MVIRGATKITHQYAVHITIKKIKTGHIILKWTFSSSSNWLRYEKSAPHTIMYIHTPNAKQRIHEAGGVSEVDAM